MSRTLVRTFTAGLLLDNYDPPRSGQGLTAKVYAAEQWAPETIVLEVDAEPIKEMTKAVYLIDNGRTIVPHYVAGWRLAEDEKVSEVFLHPMPVGENHRTWQLGPRRCYHVKVTAVKPQWSTPETFEVVNVLTSTEDRYYVARDCIANCDPPDRAAHLGRIIEDAPLTERIDLTKVNWGQVIDAVGSDD